MANTSNGTYSMDTVTLSDLREDEDYASPTTLSVIIFTILSLLVVVVIIVGNTLVCVAVKTERRLSAVQNRFLVSLAIADLTVGILIMPMGLVNQLLGYWVFGVALCQLWKVVDVLACTASIWNLCLIAIDRYYCITRAIKYNAWRTPTRVNMMIILVWAFSIFISVPPLFGWRADESPAGKFKCLISKDVGYILFSTLGSFYIPALIMIMTYAKVWRAATLRARSNSTEFTKGCTGNNASIATARNHKNKCHLIFNKKKHDGDITVNDSTSSSCNQERQDLLMKPIPSDTNVLERDGREDNLAHFDEGQSKGPDLSDMTMNHSSLQASDQRSLDCSSSVDQSKKRLAQKRERRATLVLGIIMGTFLACWYPFFQLYVISALCGDSCRIPNLLFDIIFWIGYCNSGLNPIIYTVFNRDFRRAFAKILTKQLRKLGLA